MDASLRARVIALCEAATPGPWIAERGVEGKPPDAGCGVIASNDDKSISNPSRGIVAWATRLVSRTNIETEQNAALIAEARTALPAYEATLQAAEAKIAELQEALNNTVSELEVFQRKCPVPQTCAALSSTADRGDDRDE